MSSLEEAHKVIHDEGMKELRKIFGDAVVNKEMSNASDFMRAGHELATEAAFGFIWTRPGLSHKHRSLICISILGALGKQDQLVAHVIGALNNGLTEEELKEVLLQVIVYCGVPAGVEAFKSADAAVQKWKALNDK
ncbi:4-carboxymuconolactone decarboxylase [Fomitiporia mediterranea MF3/22]|uniref:4-carboxymuconolactone decarboxylase n=1 Tax=Fomitiporia mediterranea (strain MF3/22) TaxID=694068 RepID=UPI0004407BA4|nr:4-carboxymuconolactone decarboxylase [Fomitiporia mediterranea MF3/22]EJD02788.1 4-carboxymuconolactone decarboxylase [Fomitiporia mediterranea MF3/22]